MDTQPAFHEDDLANRAEGLMARPLLLHSVESEERSGVASELSQSHLGLEREAARFIGSC
jgi:hypothetical protein